MIKWEDDRERVLDKLDKIDGELGKLKGKVFAISSSISIVVGLASIFFTKLL